MNSPLEPLTFKVSLSLSAHAQAERYHQRQGNSPKGKQVYLSSLAVYAVNFYLQCLGFETDFLNSYSNDAILSSLLNVGDLEIKNYGKLECRYVLPGEDFCYIPLSPNGCIFITIGPLTCTTNL